ncbi:hypothetical protein JD969_05905 [Planctomycetota bacterium]|nr:hypothetical protein JD969_05905 [Planctomycetota bacterium]
MAYRVSNLIGSCVVVFAMGGISGLSFAAEEVGATQLVQQSAEVNEAQLAEEEGNAQANRRVHMLSIQVEDLKRENTNLKKEMLQMKKELERLQSLESRLIVLETLVGDGKVTEGGEVAVTDGNVVEKPKYQYKYDLVWDRKKVKVRNPDDDGGIYREDRTITDPSRVGVRVLFKNNDSVPMRFTIPMKVYSKERVGGRPDSRDELGSGIESTPVLQPGELYEFTKWIRMDHSTRAKFVEVVDVKGYTTPMGQ